MLGLLGILLRNPIALLLGLIHRTWKFGGTVAGKINLQGWIGIAAALFLSLHFGGDARHFRKLYENAEKRRKIAVEQVVADQVTIARVRAATDKAKADDAANLARVNGARQALNERTSHDFEARIADARARADQLRRSPSRTDQGGRGNPAMSGAVASPSGIAEAAGEGGLPATDALIATEQAIQLDELIKAIVGQSKIPNQGPKP